MTSFQFSPAGPARWCGRDLFSKVRLAERQDSTGGQLLNAHEGMTQCWRTTGDDEEEKHWGRKRENEREAGARRAGLQRISEENPEEGGFWYQSSPSFLYDAAWETVRVRKSDKVAKGEQCKEIKCELWREKEKILKIMRAEAVSRWHEGRSESHGHKGNSHTTINRPRIVSLNPPLLVSAAGVLLSVCVRDSVNRHSPCERAILNSLLLPPSASLPLCYMLWKIQRGQTQNSHAAVYLLK